MFGVPTRLQFCWNSLFYFPIFPHITLILLLLEYVGFKGKTDTQGLNPGLPHCRQILNQLSHKGSPRILEWVAYSFPRGSSQPRNQTGVSCIAGVFFTNWAMREALQKASTWILNLLKTKKQKYIILSRNDCFLLDHRTIFLLWKFHRCSKNVIQFT